MYACVHVVVCNHPHRYGAEQGRGDLRDAIRGAFYDNVRVLSTNQPHIHHILSLLVYVFHGFQSPFFWQVGIQAHEIFVSDGSKCDIGRLQMMFGSQVSVAVQVQIPVTRMQHVLGM